MKKFRYLLIPLIVLMIFIPYVNSVYEKKCEEVLKHKDLTEIRHQYNNILRDRGGSLKDYMAKEGDLLLLGSSELSSKVPQNPINMFPFKGADYDVSIFGRAHSQSLQQASILSSINNLKPDAKIVLIVSLQWFQNPKGIKGDQYAVNFSEYQFYKMLKNSQISKENKLIYAKRNYELLKKSSDHYEERIYAGLYAKDSLVSNTILTILKPYYCFKEYLLGMKDKIQTYELLKKYPDKIEKQAKELNWDEEYENAQEQGAKAATNNPLNVDDNYYDTYLRNKYDSLKGGASNIDLMISKEMEDYEYFLKVAKELEVKPLIILMPVHGEYYDHLGINKEKRTEFYNKVQALAEKYDLDTLNLQSKEYEKYYLKDVMHLGWKGWLNVNEEISKYYNAR